MADNDDATAAQYNNLRKDVVQKAGDYASTTGSANAYVLSVDAQIVSAYVEGTTFKFKANFTNTGAPTLNVNSLGAKTIKKNNDEDLLPGDIESGQIVSVVYDGTNMQMISKSSVRDSVDTDLVAGETMDGTSNVVPVYLKASDGKLWKATATSLAEAFYNYLGVIVNSVTADVTCFLKRWGIVNYSTTLSQTVAERTITYGTGSTYYDSFLNFTSASYWGSTGFYPTAHQDNLTSIVIFGKKTGTGGGTVTANVYAMGSDGKASGGSLGSATSDSSGWGVGGAEVTFTFASPIDLTQGSTYGYVIKITVASGTGSNYVSIGQKSSGADVIDWYAKPSNTNWYNAGGGDTGSPQYYFSYSYTGVTYNPMDLVFIDTTAGQLTPTIPTYRKIVGRILSSTKIDLADKPSYGLMATDTSTLANYVMPLGVNAVEMYIEGSNSTFGSSFNAFVTKESNATQTWKGENNNSGITLTATVNWTEGLLSLPTPAGGPSFSFRFYK